MYSGQRTLLCCLTRPPPPSPAPPTPLVPSSYSLPSLQGSLAAGSPLRTLALLLAGRTDVLLGGAGSLRGLSGSGASAAAAGGGGATAHLGGGGFFGLGIGGTPPPSLLFPAGTGASGPEGDPLLRQWGANLAVMAGHRGMPGAGEAMVALGDRLRLEADQV